MAVSKTALPGSNPGKPAIDPIIINCYNTIMTKVENPDPYAEMPIGQLSNFTSVDNIFLRHGDQEGILINIMDKEPTKNAVKVLVDGNFQYWPTDGVSYVRSELRKWERA
jgi:hypothetical protein